MVSTVKTMLKRSESFSLRDLLLKEIISFASWNFLLYMRELYPKYNQANSPLLLRLSI